MVRALWQRSRCSRTDGEAHGVGHVGSVATVEVLFLNLSALINKIEHLRFQMQALKSNNWYVDAPRQFLPWEWYHGLWTDPTPPEGCSLNSNLIDWLIVKSKTAAVIYGDLHLMNTSMMVMTAFMLSWWFSTGWRLWFTSVMNTSKMVMAWSWKPSSRWAWAEIKRAEGRSPPLKDKQYSTTFSPE